ncbi:arabinoxylan arabinofuranohydrolase precursor [Fibrobacteres bacterium R8-0-B4]
MSIRKKMFLTAAAALIANTAFAANPVLRQKYTADPNPFVWNDRLYAYCSYDNNNPASSGYNIKFYTLISTDDMANWTDHGEVFSVGRDLASASYKQAYAPGAAVKDGKVYLYVPNGGSGIGVVAAVHPAGPFTGGKSFISPNAANNTNVPWLFDPAGFVDTDGQGYIYFGGGPADGSPGPGSNLRAAKLGADMMSAAFPATTISGSTRSFEAAYMHKNGSTYYFSYSQNFTNGSADIAYMTGSNPMGPFTFKGTMLPNSASGGGNNHAGVVQYKNNWYIFYHDRKLRKTNNVSSGEYRSVSVDKLEYNADGTIKQVVATDAGPAQIKNFNPYDTILATTMYKQSGAIKTAICSAPKPGTVGNSDKNSVSDKDDAGTSGDKSVMLISIANNSWINLKGVDFGTAGAAKFYASVASSSAGGSIEIRTDSNTGALAGTCAIEATGGITAWKDIECDVSSLTGVKDYLYLVFKASGTDQFRVRWYKFGGAVEVPPDPPTTTSITTSGINRIRQPLSVDVRGKTLFISSNAPAVVEIYNIKGGKEASLNVSSATQALKLSLRSGVYFAKARGVRDVRFVVR